MELIVDQLDSSAWDAFVSASPHGHFMQSHAWGELQRHSGWTPHRLAMKDGDRLRAAAQLLARSVPLTGQRVFYAPRGPVMESDPEVASAFGQAVRSYLRTRRGAFLRTDPYFPESPATEALFSAAGMRKVPQEWSYWNAPKFVFWLDLDRDETTLFKGMASSTQRDVKAGYKKDVEYRLGTAADLETFHRLMVSMSAQKGIAVHDVDYFRRLYEIMNRSSALELFLACFEGRVIAVGMSVRYGRRAWLLYAASDHEYARLNVNRNVQWEMIRWAHAAGCVRYDFRGTATGDPPSESDPGYGVYKFKKSFGPEFVRLAGYYDMVARPLMHGMLRFAEDKVLPRAYQAKVALARRGRRSSPDATSA
jgi:lipid II:glycine glycyltransferase (peptidoglycan interpeptide bridge formation enzyme)